MEQINLNIMPDGVMPVCHASQFDKNRTIRFNLKDNGSVYTLAGTETITCKVRKPDDTENTINVANTSSSYVDVTFGLGDTDLSGYAMCELKIVKGTQTIGSRNFLLNIEADAFDGSKLEERSASGAIASFETNYIDNLNELIVNITATQAGSGTPSPSNPRAISGWSSCDVVRNGINQWDEEWEIGSISDSDGSNATDNSKIRSKNYIPIKPSTDYFIVCPSTSKNGKAFFYDKNKTLISTAWFYGNAITTSPSNAYYIRFRMVDAYGTTYNHDISINYPSTDHDYHAYVGSKYQTYFEGLLAGTYGFVDLGDLSWSLSVIGGNKNRFNGGALPNVKAPASNGDIVNGICSNYEIYSANYLYSSSGATGLDVEMYGNIQVYDNNFSDANTFKTAMSGKYLIYELATPTTPTITQNDIDMLISKFNADLVCVVFGDTYYGGTLNVTTGVLTVNRGFTTKTWGSYAATEDLTTYRRRVLSDAISDAKGNNVSDICDKLPCLVAWSTDSLHFYIDATSKQLVCFMPKNTSDDTTFQICYELATPTTVQLTPTEVRTLLNCNIFADTGDIVSCKYLVEVT